MAKIFKPTANTGAKLLAGYRGPLFGQFWPLPIAQPHARAAGVLVDEFDAGL
jgi:hypothetical protein